MNLREVGTLYVERERHGTNPLILEVKSVFWSLTTACHFQSAHRGSLTLPLDALIF